jgi:hypothetical protein
MPEEATAPPAETTEGAAPSPTEGGEQQADERQDPNAWIRQSRQGLVYSRPVDEDAKSGKWDEANAELHRFRRRNGTEETPQEAQGDKEQAEPEPEDAASKVDDDQDFQRRVQAEVDRREALRAQRQRQQQERELRRTNPTEYARLKEQEEAQTGQTAELIGAMTKLSQQFDDATVTPLMQALKDDGARNECLKDAGHGLPGRKEIVARAIKSLQKSSYDEGYAKGKSEAERSARRPNSSLRKELLADLRAEEDEPDLVPGNGRANGPSDLDMNDWMRAALGRRGRATG